MAGLSHHNGRWVVSYTQEGGGRRFARFPEKAEAIAFMDANGLQKRARGRQRRTAYSVVEYIAHSISVGDDGCWRWTGRLSNAGYAALNWRPSPDEPNIPGAHRVILYLVGRPVPADLVVDHLCRTRHCVNPDHLEAVVQRENVMRSPIAPGALNAAKTHCPQGHPYSPENTYTYTFKTQKTTTRICRTCSAAHHARYYARRRGVELATPEWKCGMSSLRDTLAEMLHGTPTSDPDVLMIPGPHLVRCSFNGSIILDGHRRVASVSDGAERIAAEVRLAVAS